MRVASQHDDRTCDASAPFLLSLLRISGEPASPPFHLGVVTMDPGGMAFGFQAFTPNAQRLVGEQVLRLKTHLAGKVGRSFAGQHHMGQFFHHTPRDADWMPKALECGHGTGCQRAPIHDQRIQFDLADQVRQPTVSNGVILRIILDSTHGNLDGVQRAPPFTQPFHGHWKANNCIRTSNQQWLRHV